MSLKFLTRCCLTLCVFVTLETVGQAREIVDMNKYVLKAYGNAYYNPMSLVPLTGVLDENKDGRLPITTSRITFRGLPCACENLQCGCCAGLNISMIQFDQRACANFTFVPDEMEIRMDVSMNEKDVFSTTFSAKNPPPICAPLPYVPAINFCLRFFNVTLPKGSFKACLDFETRLLHSPILVMHFNCLKMNPQGISWIAQENRPWLVSTNVTSIHQNATTQQPGSDVFDDVAFEPENSNDFSSSTSSTLSPQQEASVGQLKL